MEKLVAYFVLTLGVSALLVKAFIDIKSGSSQVQLGQYPQPVLLKTELSREKRPIAFWCYVAFLIITALLGVWLMTKL